MYSDELSGKTALVTGASSGLGVDFARDLAARGSNLIIVARRQDRLQSVKDEITEKCNVDVLVVAMDLAQPGAPQKLYEQIKSSEKQVDILINNAGFGIFGKFIEIPWEREQEMFVLNMINLVHLTKLFINDMVDRDYGYILQVASIGGYQPSPLYATYSATKSFVLNFTEALNYELKATNVKCTALSPGVTKTEFHQVAGQDYNLFQRLSMMQSETVAKIGIEALLKGKPSVIPGVFNKIMVWSNRLVPRQMSAVVANLLMK